MLGVSKGEPAAQPANERSTIMYTKDQREGDITRNEDDALISASKVEGTACYDSTGEKLGTIDDIMLQKRSGKVAYAIMSFGGFLGIGEKYHPLPWDVLDYDTSVGGYRIDRTGQSLRDAPSYDRSAFENDDWMDSTDRYYGSSGISGIGTGQDRTQTHMGTTPTSPSRM
jgi:sporulation protein YlmC with PRC-barrel domain